ncbi:MAG: tyrosine--tRNA ligase [Candidatus Staskawiczbacteria bacterium RIFCSPHIGHO2_02_FULL_34_10]|uniref:Tyrosine--tRNA ligase n=2 Tax=Candidatus Staskawicziibacteriota TaxID=1817916 RepID=A0A1G2HKF4_9BACT|nr:MAG: tyrosine--tRNA ligase [Candidatus Staskawiczbacteria bacterium RIFCSPHIGHO2_01_FULL_34_27]OGZ66962.1 MAG: tyrosine--tRNA ligase [Candidatus Staskawiczbacteria bacterium RIFCSPHIGHO2_02_FULL_34_10]
MIKVDQEKINEILNRGVEEIFEKENLLKKLQSGKQLRIKHGIDPTGPKIHIGRAMQFWKLKEFQDLGHKIVLIIGDFTAQIGDASDKDAMRKVLTEKEIKENMKDYVKQIGKILDLKKVELHYNSEWHKKMKSAELLRLAMIFTAQQTIQRRNFKERWESGKPIGLHELSYPLLQGYDSVAVKADVETGGTDQLFNLQSGREIQKHFGQKPQDIITLKMLNGLDGRKMSTSWGNMITILDEPHNMYGKIMSMSDNLISEYFELCTKLNNKEIAEIKKMPNPRDQKAVLAKEIVKMYYSEKVAIEAAENFDKIFRQHELPSKIEIFETDKKIYPVLDLLFDSKLAESKNEAKRLVEGGGVQIDKEKIEDWKKGVELKDGMVMQVGKRRFIKIKIK